MITQDKKSNLSTLKNEKLRPQSLAQKLIAKSAGLEQVNVGDIVTCKVDLAMFHDSSGPRRLKPMLESLGAKIWDTSKVVLVLDHYVPAVDAQSTQIVELTRDVAKQWRLPNVIDSEGICHVVLPERGHLKPGMLCVGGDSHSPTGGAFGAYMFGIGATEMLGVVVTGEIWVQVPKTLRMNWGGTLQKGVSAKDMMLHMIAKLGMNGGDYQAVEFCGQAVQKLNMQERMTLSNMSAELGSQVGLIAPDQVTIEYLKNTRADLSDEWVKDALQTWYSDPKSDCEVFEFDASSLSPHVAAPHSPANSGPIESYGVERFNVAYIGACTGAKIEDLRAAAQILRGRKVSNSVKLLVAPASAREQRIAQEEGTLQALTEAGATVLPNSCGACAGYGFAFAEHDRVISSTARNFKGRMGPSSVEVFLASAQTVAASALRGELCDPREYLA
jgi:3-isopropylmalate/(R)-2-methylmalate dehydratase large subunit